MARILEYPYKGAKILGSKWANALAAWINDVEFSTAWTTISWASPFITWPGFDNAQARIINKTWVQLRGLAQMPSGTNRNLLTDWRLLTLPAQFRPYDDLWYSVTTNHGPAGTIAAYGDIEIQSDGDIIISPDGSERFSGTTATGYYFSLSGIMYSLLPPGA